MFGNQIWPNTSFCDACSIIVRYFSVHEATVRRNSCHTAVNDVQSASPLPATQLRHNAAYSTWSTSYRTRSSRVDMFGIIIGSHLNVMLPFPLSRLRGSTSHFFLKRSNILGSASLSDSDSLLTKSVATFGSMRRHTQNTWTVCVQLCSEVFFLPFWRTLLFDWILF